MRSMTKCAVAALFTAGLLGAGAGVAAAGGHGHGHGPDIDIDNTETYQACMDEQNALGLLNLDLNLLSQCIANYNR